MNRKKLYRSINFKNHIIVWSLITIYLAAFDPLPASLLVQVLATALIIFNYMLAFYALALIIIPEFHKKRFFRGGGLLLLLAVLFYLLDLLNFNYLMPALGFNLFYSTTWQVITLSIKPFILISVPAVGYFFNDVSLEKIEIQNIREKSLLLKELNFLKNQFNSHITFNFLNYCYSKVHQLSGDTAEAIEVFSNMLRYSLTIKPESKVGLEKEILYIEDFIRLQKLLSAEVHVTFTCPGEFTTKLILPSMLITFIENAFKHGEFTKPSEPIIINLEANDSSIILIVSNKKRVRKSMASTGVGLENVRQLLQLYYPEKHSLQIENTTDTYVTKLNLSLS